MRIIRKKVSPTDAPEITIGDLSNEKNYIFSPGIIFYYLLFGMIYPFKHD
jgi:hypothetical protein